MNNEINENNTSLTEKETGINREFFENLIESLSEEDKKYIGPVKDFKNDTIGEVLKKEDKPKIEEYDKLNVKNLPEDWELKLARLKYLEKELVNYGKVKEELKGWTDIFGSEIKPQEVEKRIEEQEKENERIESEAKEKIENLKKDLECVYLEKDSISESLNEKVKELETKLKEWTSFFAGKELEEIKEELEELRKRPDTNISTEEFYNDYCKRKSLRQSELEGRELEKERERNAKLEKEIREFYWTINQIIEIRRIQEYATAEPAINQEQAQKAIVKLLNKTEQEWENYFAGGENNIGAKNLILGLSFQDKNKRNQAQQVLAWIKEAKENKDYQKLYEKWNGGNGYNKENDFDGSLSVLKKYLEVEEEEIL